MIPLFTLFAPRQNRYPLLPRPRLFSQAPGEAALTVVRATAGMGKTTLINELMARAARRGPVYVSEPAGVGTESWAAEVETLLQAEPAVTATVCIDQAERHQTERFSEILVALLESHPGLNLIVAGSFVHGLDERWARLRVPVHLITDEDLRFTSHEVAELVQLRLPSEGDGLGARLFNLTRGWPLAVHDALITAAQSTHVVVSEHRIDEFCADLLQSVLPLLNPHERAVLMLAGAVEELTPRLVGYAFEIDSEAALNLLSNLAHHLLMQRVDGHGVRNFRLHQSMRRVLWRARRQLTELHEIELWAGRLADSEFEVAEDVAWVEIYAAFDAQDWGKLNALLLCNFTEELMVPSPVLRAQLQAIPDAAQQKYPLLRLTVLLEEFAFPQGRRGRVLVDLREIATRAVNDESHTVGVIGVLAAGMRLGTSRLTGDSDTAVRMVQHLQGLFDRLDLVEQRRARSMVATACGQLAITAWYLDDFDRADAWCAEGINLGTSPLSISRVHLTSLAAVNAAWRGDIPETKRRLEICDSIGFQEKWGNHFVAVGYWIARAIVALEARDFAGATSAYERVSWRQATNEHWPYMVWLKTQILEEEVGGDHALAWLDGQIEAHKRGFALMPGPRRALDGLRTRLVWQHGRYQLLPARRTTRGLSGVYADFAEGDFVSAATRAAAVVEAAARQGFWRLEASALLLQAIAEQGNADQAGRATRERALNLLSRYELTTPQRERAPWWDAARDTDHDEAQSAAVAPTSPAAALDPPVARPRTAGHVSRAELRALRAVAQHGSAPAAAKELQLSVHTVRDQMKSVYRKLGVRTRAEAIHVAAATGLLTPRSS